MTPLWRREVRWLAAAFRDGAARPDDLVEQLLERIDRHDGRLGAYTALNPDLRAEAADSAARLRGSAARGPLEGIPLAIKDNLVVAGMPSSWGSALLRDQVADRDEAPIARLRAAGALFIGKTNCPEFAVEGYTANDTFGVTRNPFDLSLTPGGSSGGAVAAVAAGLAPAAIGTDGGGSLRRPAGYTGLVGFKPGTGYAARAEGLPQVLLDFEVVGPLTRTVSDAALIGEVLHGPDPRDPASCAYVADSRPIRSILYVPRLGDAPCAPEILAAADGVAATLKGQGIVVRRGTLPFDIDALADRWPAITEIGLGRLLQRWPDMQEAANPRYLRLAYRGTGRPAPDLLEILEVVQRLRSEAGVALGKVDAILMPTAAAMPWAADRPFPTKIDGQTVGPRGHAIYTGWVNAAGLPAVAVPAPVPEGDMPVGVQIVAARGRERPLLALAERLSIGQTVPSGFD